MAMSKSCIASPPNLRQFDYILRRGAGDDRLQPPSPCIEGLALFCGVRIAVIDSGDAFDRSASMVENCFDDMRGDTEPGHAARGRPAKIVERPTVRSSDFRAAGGKYNVVDRVLRATKARYRSESSRREYQRVLSVADSRKLLEEGDRRVAQRDFVRDPILRTLLCDCPGLSLKIDFAPSP